MHQGHGKAVSQIKRAHRLTTIKTFCAVRCDVGCVEFATTGGRKPMVRKIPQVDAPDPERRTSPIIDEVDEDAFELDHGPGVCYFNDIPYEIGAYVLCGNELLKCEGAGVWVRRGELRTDELDRG
jgi:hypothetical protein